LESSPDEMVSLEESGDCQLRQMFIVSGLCSAPEDSGAYPVVYFSPAAQRPEMMLLWERGGEHL
ncbi:Hypothetical predicted protein, partial [Podarcis lilfordi]